jgi:protease-4
MVMRRFIVGFFALIGFLAFLPIVALIFSLYRWSAPTLPFLNQDDPYVLSLTLGDESLREHTPRGGVASLIEGSTQSVHTLIEGINHAAKDDHIKGLLLTFEGNVLKQATAQEIRDALKAFKASGKFIYTYAHSFGELSNGTMNYYLAALSSKIWMMPLGTLNFNGIMIEVPFAKKALDDLKIHTQLGHREEYKGMIESLTQTDFSPPYRENMQRIISALTAQIIKDVAVGRGLEVDEVQKILNNSPYTPKEAIDHKMIDEIGYKDEVKEAIQKLLGKKPTYRDFDSYSQSMKSPSGKDKIAIVYAEGSISKGKATRSPLSDELVLDAPEIAKALREAREDDSVKAIVLRIDSPGGNPIASELIGREMELTKPKKPVIVSMSNYAASGGYWIACNARKIVAQPGTITGSIGFYAGKIVTQELWDSLGIHWGEIHEGNQAGIWSSGHLYSDAEQE